MSKNIDQIYIANPITSNAPTDLIYIGQSPYGSGNDAAIKYSDFAAQGVTSTQVLDSAFNYGTDTGIADAYIVNLSPTVTSLTDGMLVMFLPTHANATTSPTLQINSLAAVAVGSATSQQTLVANDFNTSGLAILRYNAAASAFMFLNPAITTLAPVNIQQGGLWGGTDSGIADAYVVSSAVASDSGVVPLLGAIISFTPGHANATTTPTLNYNASGIATIVGPTGGPLAPGDLSGSVAAFLFKGASNYYLLNPVQSTINITDIQTNNSITGNDTGSANLYVWTSTIGITYGAPVAGGTIILNVSTNANTGASTLNAGGGPLAIVSENGNALVGGEIVANGVYYFLFNNLSQWVLLNPSITPGGVTSTQVQQSAFNVAGVDTGTADAHVVALTPAITSYTDGLLVAFNPSTPNLTNAPTLDAGGGPAGMFLPNVGPAPATLVAGDLGSGIAYCIYSTNRNAWVLLNPAQSSTQSTLVQTGWYIYGNVTGIADAYVVTLNLDSSLSLLVTGATVSFRPLHSNVTTSPTLNVNGLGAHTIRLLNGQNVVAGDLQQPNPSANYVTCMWDATNGWLLLNPYISVYTTAQQTQGGLLNHGTDTGAADAYAVALTPAITAYTDGLQVTFNPANVNLTTIPTLAINGLAAKTITSPNVTIPVATGDLSNTQLAWCIYSSAAGVFMLMTPAVSGF